MSDNADNPYYSAAESAPPNRDWRARRRVAAAARRLIEALVTREVDAGDLEQIATALDAQTARLQSGQARPGRMSWVATGAHGDVSAVDYELSPFNGRCNVIAPPMQVWVDGDRVRGRVRPGWQYEGPPECLHGGMVAALFDQFLGVCQLLTDKAGVTGTLSIRYLNRTPLNEELSLLGWVDRIEGRKIFLVAEMRAGDICTARCEGLFIVVDEAEWGITTTGAANVDETAPGTATPDRE